MNNQYLVNAISKLLQGLEMKVANKVLADVQASLKSSNPPCIKQQPCANTFRPSKSKIANDPELEQFLLDLPPLELTHIVEILTEKFGKDRAPSRSVLSRYFRSQRNVK